MQAVLEMKDRRSLQIKGASFLFFALFYSFVYIIPKNEKKNKNN